MASIGSLPKTRIALAGLPFCEFTSEVNIMWTVYKHTAPNGKVYIGITSKTPVRRFGRKGQGYKSNPHFWNAIQRYGWDSITHEILFENLTFSEAGNIEKQLIAEYRSADPEHGYNIALGGQGNTMNDCTRLKLSKRQKAVWCNQEYKEKRIKEMKERWASEEYKAQHSGKNASMYGHHHSQETKENIAITRKERNIPHPCIGRKLSDETKAKISRANSGRRYSLSEKAKEHIRLAKLGNKNPNYGRPLSKTQKKHLIEINSKPVIQVKNDCEIKYQSAADAGRATGIVSSNITRVCKGERKTAGGFKWRYA